MTLLEVEAKIRRRHDNQAAGRLVGLTWAGFINLPHHSFPIVSAAHHLFALNLLKNPTCAFKPGHVPGLQDRDSPEPACVTRLAMQKCVA